MKRLLIVLVLVAGFATGNPVSTATLPEIKAPNLTEATAYPVLRVIDGDTIIIQRDGKHVTVRLEGVDTPETVHPRKPVQRYGKEASTFVTNLLKGEHVYLLPGGGNTVDRYGRALGYVYRYPDGLFVNAEIIRQGYGFAYMRYPHTNLEQFKKLEAFARVAGKGLWAKPAPSTKRQTNTFLVVPNSRFVVGAAARNPYAGVVGKRVFHRRNCRRLKRVDKGRLVGYATVEDARRAGRRACRVCKPLKKEN